MNISTRGPLLKRISGPEQMLLHCSVFIDYFYLFVSLNTLINHKHDQDTAVIEDTGMKRI